MADTSDVDDALVAFLAGDAALSALMPDGVWIGISAPHLSRFVIVSLITSEDVDEFADRAFERLTYQVKAVALDTSFTRVKQAAYRIDQLLADAAATFAVPGFATLSVRRVEHFRYPERDPATDVLWQHGGGDYEFWLQPTAAPMTSGGIDNANSR